MNPKKFLESGLPRLLLTAVCGCLLTAIPAAAQITIFSDNFDGGTGNLNGTTPDTTTGGATWVAASGTSDFNADGTFVGGGAAINTKGGSATLAFTPTVGLIYTLDATVSGMSLAVGSTSWIALGFAHGQSTLTNNKTRFVSGGTVLGRAWMLSRGDGGAQAALTDGTTTNIPWPSSVNDDDGLDMRIVLDTTGGTGNWSATWFAKRTIDSAYTTVRVADYNFVESITSVGFAVSGAGVSGTLESFSLTKDGGGTLTLAGINTYTGNLTVNRGTLNLTGNRTAAHAQVIVGSEGNTAELNISNGNLAISSRIQVGTNISNLGTVNHTAGTVNLTGGDQLLVGTTTASGTCNLSGGSLPNMILIIRINPPFPRPPIRLGQA